MGFYSILKINEIQYFAFRRGEDGSQMPVMLLGPETAWLAFEKRETWEGPESSSM